jgi:hypothetical protein
VQINNDVVEVRNVDLPKTLVDAGYTPSSAAETLTDLLRMLRKEAFTATRLHARFDTVQLSTPEVPLLKIKLTFFLDYLRAAIGRQRRSMAVQITEGDDATSFNVLIRVSGWSDGPRMNSFSIPNSKKPQMTAIAEQALRILDPYLIAALKYRSGIKDEALTIGRECSQYRDAPYAPQCLNLIGQLSFEKNDQSDAEAFFRAAVDSDPQCAICYNNFGGLRETQNRLSEAAIFTDCYVFTFGKQNCRR